MHYQIYRPIHEVLARAMREELKANKKYARELFGCPLKAARPEALYKLAVRTKLIYNASQQVAGVLAMDTVVLIEEWAWRHDGCHVYFPLPGLLDSLYDSKMEVDPEALQFPRRLFTLAIPKDETVGGMPLPPALVGNFSLDKKRELINWFNGDIRLDQPIELMTDRDADRSIFVTYANAPDKNGNCAVTRCSVPYRKLNVLLNNPHGADREGEYLREVVGDYKDVPGLVEMSNDERRTQYRLVKSIVSMAIYMLAFPNSVKDGYPEQFTEDGGTSKAREPHVVGGQHFRAERGSPVGHWRRKHFRSYPTRRDGTKKAGLVEVRGAWVNPDSPHTVVSVDEEEDRT